MPAFEALLRAGRATAAVLHIPQASASSIPAALALPLPVPVLATQLGSASSIKKAAQRVREAGRDGEPQELPSHGSCPIA